MKLNKLLILSVCSSLLLANVSYAGVFSSDQVMQSQLSQYNKQQILTMLDSRLVEDKMIALGVSREQAYARINAMTPAEINSLNQQLNDAPAGKGVVGTIVTVLVVIAVLDVLGITDVYPFIRPINS